MFQPKGAGLKQMLPSLQHVGPNLVRCNGKKLIYFGGCDYYRFSYRKEIRQAIADALSQPVLNVAASRVTTGNAPEYPQLELKIARFFGTESALFLPTGYLPNLVVGQALKDQFTHALLDERCHASMVDGSRSLGCPSSTFPHASPEGLAKALSKVPKDAQIILLTDGVFSFSGQIAPLAAYRELLPQSAWLWVDDCHGVGILGKAGRGTPSHAWLDQKKLVHTITFSKAFGSYGGAVLSQKSLYPRMVQRSGVFIGSTPLPIPMVAGTSKSMDLMQKNAEARDRLSQLSCKIKETLREAGLQTPADSDCIPIVQIIPQTKAGAESLRKSLLKVGIYPPLIRYLSGPAAGYFRIVLSSEHTADHIGRLMEVLEAYLRRHR